MDAHASNGSETSHVVFVVSDQLGTRWVPGSERRPCDKVTGTWRRKMRLDPWRTPYMSQIYRRFSHRNMNGSMDDILGGWLGVVDWLAGWLAEERQNQRSMAPMPGRGI